MMFAVVGQEAVWLTVHQPLHILLLDPGVEVFTCLSICLVPVGFLTSTSGVYI